MALKVWLPLNKDLKNTGLSKVTVINNGATLDTNGVSGNCYNIALGKYIGLDAPNVNNHKYSPISIALWIYPTQNDSTERDIICCFESGGYGLYLKSQKICFCVYVNGYKYCEMPTTISLNTWHHICGTYDEKIMRLYIDGQEVKTTSVSGKITYNSTCPWEIGGNPGATAFATGNFVGKVNDIRIYDNVLSSDDVQRIYSNGIKTLQIRLPFNYNIKNIGLQKNEIISTPSITPSYIEGPYNSNALSFNGSTYWKSQNINLADDLTVCCWSKTSTNGKMTWVLESDACLYLNIYEISIYTLNTGDGNKNPFKTDSNANINVIHNNTWHHFAVTFGNSITKLYIDGTYRGKATTYKNPKTTNKPIKIGGGFQNAHSYDWNGGISVFSVYNHCLSEDDIKRIYNSIPDVYKIIDFLKFLPGQYINTNLSIAKNDQTLTKATLYYEAGQSTRDLMGWNTGGGCYWGVTTASTWEWVSTYTNADITQLNSITFSNKAPTTGTYKIGELYNHSTRTKYIKSFQISINGVVQRDFYACYRKSDKKYGMYDMITKTFYTNAGSGGDFTGI